MLNYLAVSVCLSFIIVLSSSSPIVIQMIFHVPNMRWRLLRFEVCSLYTELLSGSAGVGVWFAEHLLGFLFRIAENFPEPPKLYSVVSWKNWWKVDGEEEIWAVLVEHLRQSPEGVLAVLSSVWQMKSLGNTALVGSGDLWRRVDLGIGWVSHLKCTELPCVESAAW